MAAPRICSVKGCNKPVFTLRHGLCNAHDKRRRRYGDPLAGGTFRAPRAAHCSVAGCPRPVYSSALCQGHWWRKKRYGSPIGGGAEKGALKRWVHDHVDHEGEDCLIWPFAGSGDGHGYGHLYVDGKTVRAHRYMCELAHGPAPSAKHDAAHSCGRGHEGCINPRHLRWATRVENVADMLAHGTALIGEKAPWARLTADNVRFIRSQQGKALQKDLAARFGVSRSMIGAIQTRKRWRYLD